jgi:ribosomal-protein-alanine N-acetyltransferase
VSDTELVLSGPRLHLRYPRAEDAAALFALASDPEVTRFFSWGPYRELAEAREWLGTLPARRETGTALELAIVGEGFAGQGAGEEGVGVESGAGESVGEEGGAEEGGAGEGGAGEGGAGEGAGLIGITLLSEFSKRDRRCVVGTWLGRPHWGTGANLEVKALVARLAFERLGIERLGAYADLRNGRSQVALERVGFEREGVLRAFHRHGDEPRDVATYALLRADWPRSPLASVKARISGEPPAAFRV